MKLPVFLLFLTAVASAQHNTLTPQESAEGWILLFDGTSLFGLTQEMKAQWRVADGALIGDAGDYGWLRSNSAFADYVLKCDYRTAADGNSGIFLRSAKEGLPHITGYELQIFDKHPQFPTGSIVEYIKAKPVSPAPGQWHTYEVELTGNHFVVKLDGAAILYGRNDKSRAGYIGFQYNKDKKIEFRNIKLKPLGLRSLFNGKDLKGWQEVAPSKKAKEPAVWSVRDAAIHVEQGPGQLETEATFKDFVLQLDVKTNANGPSQHPNSGVFVRGEKGGFWTGYESQIRNEYKDSDRTKPIDFGTGGIYHLQAARRVVSNDNEFFTKTIVARGRHLAVWVNGYPVSDHEDERPQAPVGAGVMSLQAHDPTTNLDFRNIRLAEMP
ncbi:MAG: DUF1080 domain-containing protein [Bryobacteraceae bacterium]